MRLRSKVVGVPEAAGALEAMGKELGGRALRTAALSGAKILENAWRDEVGYVTGSYKRSIQSRVTAESQGRVEVTVGTDIVKPPYPWVLEYGMTICVKTAKWLTFKTKDGAWHRVKCVTIPPKGWARRAWDKSIGKVEREIADALMYLVDKHWR